MDEQQGEQFVRGLTLRLDGAFDAMAMMQALPLRPIRAELASTNQICDVASGQALMYTPKERVQHDHLTATTTATPSEMYPIAHHFEVLFHAIAQLPPALKQSWDQLPSRTVTLDLLWTNEPSGGTDYILPESLTARLATAKLTLHLSVFASVDAVDRACQARQQTL